MNDSNKELLMIPECIHPLVKAWDQPKTTDIETDDTHALMSKKSFDELSIYSCSVPTGVYAGKMWKGWNLINWYLRWYETDPMDKNICLVKSRIIIITENSP